MEKLKVRPMFSIGTDHFIVDIDQQARPCVQPDAVARQHQAAIGFVWLAR